VQKLVRPRLAIQLLALFQLVDTRPPNSLHFFSLTFVGELGFELHVPSGSASAVYRAVREAGDLYSKTQGVPVRDGGYRAIDSLSAEKNFRHWHADLCNRDTPMEAGIGFTVLSKLKRTGQDAPDFLGREALEAAPSSISKPSA